MLSRIRSDCLGGCGSSYGVLDDDVELSDRSSGMDVYIPGPSIVQYSHTHVQLEVTLLMADPIVRSR
jgi:hypothetical protein